MAKTNNNNEITINQTLLNDSKVVVGKWNDRVKTETNRKNELIIYHPPSLSGGIRSPHSVPGGSSASQNP